MPPRHGVSATNEKEATRSDNSWTSPSEFPPKMVCGNLKIKDLRPSNLIIPQWKGQSVEKNS